MKLFRRLSGGAAAAITAGLVLAACGGAKSTTSSTTPPSSSASSTTVSASAKTRGGTATWAIPAAQVPNWIFPFMSLAYFSTTNVEQFQFLMYRPLYWFGKSGEPVVNESLSLADPPSWSANGKVVTIQLKPYKWSDGETVDASDVAFWQNLVTAEKANWAAYVPGSYPDNVVGTKVVSSDKIEFILNRAWNQRWFLYNELSQVTPLPAAWDITHTGAKAGSGGCATSKAKCPAVYKFLTAQAKAVHTYASNPLWQVVDGPWKLSQYQTTGYSVFVPNPRYSGPVKPTLSKFIEQPFTTESAEYNDITSGRGPDVGYLPFADLPQKSRLASLGYTLAPWTPWETNYFPENFNGPHGAIFRQLYVRQALQMVMDQPGVIKSVYHGYAFPVYGPVPAHPKNPFADSFEEHNPYPFSPTKAKKLITSHGWTIEHGVATCTSPGSGASHCGSGVKAGATMNFNLQYEAGVPEIDQSMKIYKSNAALAGIKINLSQAPFDTVISNSTPCKPGSKCTWDMENWGAGWIWAPDYYPTGDEIFATGAGSNSGSYSNKVDDANILATQTAKPSQAQAALDKYQNFLTKQLPVIWQPLPYFQLTLIKSTLKGVTPQNPLTGITPANWYFTKK
jgi:peptide/nickel transport system substrate-binding protein